MNVSRFQVIDRGFAPTCSYVGSLAKRGGPDPLVSTPFPTSAPFGPSVSPRSSFLHRASDAKRPPTTTRRILHSTSPPTTFSRSTNKNSKQSLNVDRDFVSYARDDWATAPAGRTRDAGMKYD